jgi:hypothetical protein
MLPDRNGLHGLRALRVTLLPSSSSGLPMLSLMKISRCARIFLSYSPCSAAHARGMEDANAMAAVQEAGGKWHWYLLRNPFYNSTVSIFRLWPACCARTLC